LLVSAAVAYMTGTAEKLAMVELDDETPVPAIS
jgi:hypothetical protein